MDPRRALALLVEWGADEALDVAPQVHLRPSRAADAAAPDLRAASSEPVPLPGGLTQARKRVQNGSPMRIVSGAEAYAAHGAHESLAEFAAALAHAEGAGLAATATHVVAPTGEAGGLLALAEAPGAAEDRTGQAFVGPEGLLVRRMLASLSREPHPLMLAYLVPWRPPGERMPSASEVAACLPLLHRLLCLAHPLGVLALGSSPARALLGQGARRGRWGEAMIPGRDRPIAVLPTINPALLLRHPQQKADAWTDLRAVQRRLHEGSSKR